MAYRLIMPLDFLASSHVPPVCIFTGRQEPTVKITRMPVSLVVKNKGTQQAIKIILPTSPGAARTRKMIDAIPLLSLLVTGMVISGLTCAVLASSSELRRWSSESSRGPLKWILIGLFLAVGSAATWMINLWMQARFVTMTVIRNGKAVEVHFPERYRATLEIYQAALKSYEAVGSPPPDSLPVKPNADRDDWADTVKPGWDESKS